MNVIAVVRKYLIQDLTGIIENYYMQDNDEHIGMYGCWDLLVLDESDHFLGACQEGHMEIIMSLMLKGAKKGVRNWNDGFDAACAGGQMKVVKLMMDVGVHYDLNSGMYYASREGHLDIVKLLIEKGANNRMMGYLGACFGQHPEVKKYFENGMLN